MKSINAEKILPKDLIDKIQEYVQGKYVYIPVKNKLVPKLPPDYTNELAKRNEHIYTKYLEGIKVKKLSDMYHLSESSIRRIIIKQREEFKMTGINIREAVGLWNIKEEPVKQVYNTTWQIGEKYILKTYSDKKMMRRNIEIMKILDNEGIPVGKIVPAGNGDDHAEYKGQYYFICTKLPGNNLVKICNNLELALTAGKVIARLHTALLECEKKIDVWDNSLLDEMNGWMIESFQKNDWKYISKAEYNAVTMKLEALYDKLPRQLIHRDVHFGNFLFDNGCFSGYIDFDLSQRNIRIFDLCYFLLGLLSEEDKYEISREQWILFAEGVFSGYESEIELLNDEKRAVPYVMEAIELLFTAYFLECNDEYCARNAFNIYEFICSKETQLIPAY